LGERGARFLEDFKMDITSNKKGMGRLAVLLLVTSLLVLVLESKASIFSQMVEQNLNINSVTGSGYGWSVCHTSTYISSVNFTDVITRDCNKARLMFACRDLSASATNLIVAASNYRSVVLADVGSGGFIGKLKLCLKTALYYLTSSYFI
jgi:hypothetical protein